MDTQIFTLIVRDGTVTSGTLEQLFTLDYGNRNTNICQIFAIYNKSIKMHRILASLFLIYSFIRVYEPPLKLPTILF